MAGEEPIFRSFQIWFVWRVVFVRPLNEPVELRVDAKTGFVGRAKFSERIYTVVPQCDTTSDNASPWGIDVDHLPGTAQQVSASTYHLHAVGGTASER